MAETGVVRIHLPPPVRARAEAGRDPFLSALGGVLEAAGLSVVLRDDGPADLVEAAHLPGPAIFRMIDPPHPDGVTFRRGYLGPFWHIEKHGRRWDWPVARAAFDPSEVNPPKAARFAGNWRHRLFGDAVAVDGGFILVPLQGRLLAQRSFQTCAPMAMLDAVLRHDPRPVVATLHPQETYSTPELDALRALAGVHPRLSVQTGGSDALLPRCSFVVTQNSSVALKGFLLDKPAVLFARIDFHHIGLRVTEIGAEAALAAASAHRPDFAAYLWWFFRRHAIDISRPDAAAQIAAALRRAGWVIP
ncbi:hypothetical protein [Thetidibacter halocola]|uniref:Capsular polysaccharide biosynthesis protein n=1 Tax=Thetidibacter halocola TaxID=2827239 RepID=A0A8J8B9P9_9RHOB|nr:hypothetical protein [Thetidibacter halocola]MBS0125775.1 hypothetical protein [Thetidibacter halocola]